MSTDLLNPPAPTMSETSSIARRAHLMREIELTATTPAHEVHRRRGLALHRRHPPLRAMGRKAGLAVALAALIAALIAVLPGKIGHHQMTLIDRAIAAIGSGPTIHVVLDQELGTRRVDFQTGKTTLTQLRTEIWFDPKFGNVQITTLDGKPLQRVTAPPSVTAPSVEWWGPLVVGYRSLLKRGSYHVVGSGQIAGRPVDWIASKPKLITDLFSGRVQHEWVQEVAISTTTYKPLYMRTRVDGVIQPDSGIRIITAETLPRRPTVFSHPHAIEPFGVTPTAPSTTLRDARTAMNPDPIVPAAHLDGLKRTWIGLPRYLRQGNSYLDQIGGVELFYGRIDHDGKPIYNGSFISITEFPQINPAVLYQGTRLFPNDAAIITNNSATMKTHGLYIIIQAGSPAQALTAARALSH